MNHRDAEVTEKKKAEISYKNGCSTCLVPFILFFAIIAFLCCGIPLLRVVIHYIQWQFQDIDEYEISFSAAGYWVTPSYLEYVETDDGLIDMMTMKSRSGYDAINGLFSTAFQNAFIPFCSNHTEYNSEYGFPSKVGCYFAEGGWVEVTHFKPIPND